MNQKEDSKKEAREIEGFVSKIDVLRSAMIDLYEEAHKDKALYKSDYILQSKNNTTFRSNVLKVLEEVERGEY